MLEKVADFARRAVKLAEPYKPYGVQFLEFCSISLSTYQTCMKLPRKSTEFCQFFCRQNPPDPSSHPVSVEVREFDWDSSRKGASQLPRTTTIRLSTPKTTTGEILIFALTSPLTCHTLTDAATFFLACWLLQPSNCEQKYFFLNRANM